MACKWCDDTGILMMVTRTLHGKDFRAEQCECELEAIHQDRKDDIYDVHKAVPKSANCSKEGAVSPE